MRIQKKLAPKELGVTNEIFEVLATEVDSDGAGAGDVLTADGTGGSGWQAPAGNDNDMLLVGDGWSLLGGGDDRGLGAVDMQYTRANDTQVASGDYSTIGGGTLNTANRSRSTIGGGQENTASGVIATIGGGYCNTASGYNVAVSGGGYNAASGGIATIGGGLENTASGDIATIGGGLENTASGNYATIGGGRGNTANFFYATIGGGKFNTASGDYSTISGGYRANADKYGQFSQASGMFLATGDAQTSVLVARKSTTDATPAELFLDGVNDRITIDGDTTWTFEVLVTARRTDANNESAGYHFLGVIDNNAGTTALVGAVAKTVIAEDTGAWDCNVTADDANDALVITATGENAKTIRWVARVTLVETTG